MGNGGEKGGKGRGRRVLIHADGMSFHEYWPSTVSLAPYRFARDIARVLCRSLARSLVHPFRSFTLATLARSRNPRSNGRLRNRSWRQRALRSASLSLPLVLFFGRRLAPTTAMRVPLAPVFLLQRSEFSCTIILYYN